MAKQYGGKSQTSLRDYQSALTDACETLPALVVVGGESEFLRSEAAAAFRDAWLAKYPLGDVTTVRGMGEGRPVSLADVTRELSGASLFARDKLVVVRQAEKLLFPSSRAGDGDGDSGGAREKSFLAWVEKPSAATWLLVETAQLPKNRTLGKRLAGAGVHIPCASPSLRELPGWLNDRALRLDKTLDHAALDLLLRAHGADLGVLAGEVEKLALFAGEKRGIDAAMVGEFMTGSIEFDIFGFTNAVEARDCEQALFFARRIGLQGSRDQKGKKEDGKSSSHRVLAMLAGTVQGLLRAGVARARRVDAAEFAAEEKLSPWRAGRLLEASARFQLRELRMMARVAADQLRRVHDTGGDPLLSLEIMAVRFTRSGMLESV